MPASTIPTLRSKLIAVLAARAALANVQITDGLPDQPDSEFLALLEAEATREPAFIGNSRWHETYDQTVVVSVLYMGDSDHKAAQERALALLDQVVLALEADPTVGVKALLALRHFRAELSGFRLETRGPSDNRGREAAILATVHCQAVT
jgi:hypothetical protein